MSGDIHRNFFKNI